ncbi:MAG: S9 family peptidase [Xanthomarina sp.]|uniref:S9 family peptidase n=1 Tax=Xanthomarina sp. TaxID=1931211 RepID=UPI000C49F8E8|nr:S9 family peptidase [Xanthomarina sp.]MAL23176.1 S9 family peptidase [Xanthomarina sp.]MBF60621.1 S9 family peptidase [Xanthomarina sp.]|tara:strand:+ start:605 stop:2836 length:2232 start_codon:yes stop_codon:yes gene_type:complete
MKFTKLLLLFCIFATFLTSAQNKEITLEDIWTGAFRTEGMDALHSMKNGQQYSVLNFDRTSGTTSIDVYDYKTLKKVKTLVNSNQLEAIPNFSDYTISEDESNILLATDVTRIFRRSSLGTYYVYNTKTKDLSLVAEEQIQEPTFSPDGTKIAYGYKNNLFVKDLSSGTTTQITFDGEKNKIINGITDWVYEEEFGFVRAFEWNAASDKIAFIRFDETQVPEFSMDVYGSALYPTQDVFKYPKAGEANALVSLHLYELKTDTVTEVKVNKDYTDFYIPRIKWTNDPDVLSAHYLNRHQNELDLWFIDAKNQTATLVLEERDVAYVDVTDNLTFLKDNSFIWTSEKDGYNHIYHYSKEGDLINQVTKGNWEVTSYYGYDEKSHRIFYQSTENGSINRDIYSIKLNGRDKERLTKSEGTNRASFSADFSYFINTFSNASTPPEYTLNDAKTGDLIKSIKDNDKLSETLLDYKTSKKEFSTIHVNGNDLNMWMIKPADFDASKEYPLFMYQYSGPGSQSVSNTWNSANDYWYQYLAQKGYIVACVDGRGTGYKGADFKKVTQKELGKYEVEDQIEAARQLGKLPYIDASRIGIWGWSYGGFMSSNALFKGNDVFKMAIAVAPVTSWRFYDSVYTERYMTTPQENPSGYDDNSPINHVDKLKGDFLLIHGTADDNVHVQNTMRMVEALVQANKQFEWMIYPDKNHGIYGGNTRLHLYTKMSDFIDRTLGDKIPEASKNHEEKVKIKG